MKNNSSIIKVLAPAKINLTLDITGKLPNGYHTVDMVMQSVGLYDEITVEKKETFGKSKSVNGAGVLVALNKLYDTKLSTDELSEIAAEIGADVPFCLYGGTMLATGIGTDLQKIEHSFKLDKYFVVLCKPPINVSTPEAYRKADSRPFSENIHSKSLIEALMNESETAFFDSLYNDFDSLLNLEDVQNIKNTMNKYGCIKAVMSGSGPTVYGFFTNSQQAEASAASLKEAYDDVCITKVCGTGCKTE